VPPGGVLGGDVGDSARRDDTAAARHDTRKFARATGGLMDTNLDVAYRLYAGPQTADGRFLRELLHPEQQAYLDRLRASDAAVASAYRLTQAFAAMVRERTGERLDAWLAAVDACAVPALTRFAVGLRADLAAVRAGRTAQWSNGPTEGFVHQLKLLKRQSYGRAGFAMLRRRIVLAA